MTRNAIILGDVLDPATWAQARAPQTYTTAALPDDAPLFGETI